MAARNKKSNGLVNRQRGVDFQQSIYDKLQNGKLLYQDGGRTLKEVAHTVGVSYGYFRKYIAEQLPNDQRKQVFSSNKKQTANNWRQNHLNQLDDFEWVNDKIVNEKWTCNQFAEYLGVHLNTIHVAFRERNVIVPSGRSVNENWLKSFLDQLNVCYTIKNRKIIPPLELDFYFPENHFGVELNGVFWHSDDRIDKNYHLNKTLLAKDAGVDLLHFWEHELYGKTDVVKSIINQKLHLNKPIYARRTNVLEVDQNTARKFYDDNHILQTAPTSFNYGLSYNGQLVALIGFSKSRFSKHYQYELVRYCNLVNTSVVGGGSKLFQHFLKTHNPQSIGSYCQRRLFTGQLYTNLGMDFVHNSPPSYFWWKNDKGIRVLSRYQTQKHKLEGILPNQSEPDYMRSIGYRRVWDCGHSLYRWDR